MMRRWAARRGSMLFAKNVAVATFPISRSTELSSVVMHEVAGNRTVVGDVLLGRGARPVKEALQWPAAARAVVVLIRGGEDDDTAFKGAAEGVVVMTVDPAVSWSELAAVVLRIGVSWPRNRIRPWPNGFVRLGPTAWRRRQAGRR